jgi:hypothetical protein
MDNKPKSSYDDVFDMLLRVQLSPACLADPASFTDKRSAILAEAQWTSDEFRDTLYSRIPERQLEKLNSKSIHK